MSNVPEGNIRLVVGDYTADVLVGMREQKTIYYYIIQRAGSAEVVDLAYFPTLALATAKARAAIENLARRERRAATH